MRRALSSLLRAVANLLSPPAPRGDDVRVSPEQIRKALVDVIRDPESRRLIFAPSASVRGGVPSTNGRIPKYSTDTSSLEDTVTPIVEKNVGGNWYAGIGTPDPELLLHIKGTIPSLLCQDGSAADRINLQTILGSMYLFVNAKYASGQYTSFNTSNPAWLIALGNGSGGGDAFALFRAGASGSPLTFTEFLRCSSTGNFGIGTASPSAKVHGVGDAKFVADAAATVPLTAQGAASQSGISSSGRIQAAQCWLQSPKTEAWYLEGRRQNRAAAAADRS